MRAMAARTTPEITPRLIAAKRAAAITGIPYTSLRDIVHRGELCVIRVGRAWYIETADLDRWIETRKAEA
jgi:excisionase family DNA binding protein